MIPAVLLLLAFVAGPSVSTDPPGREELRQRLIRPETSRVGSDTGGYHAGALAGPQRSSSAAVPAPMDGSGRRSVALAFGASAILPGAGQAYNGQWVKAGIALAIEAAIVTLYSVRRSNGLDDERLVKAFAHEEWSPTRYATWLNDYTAYLTDELGHSVTAPPAQIPTGIDFANPSTWSDAELASVTGFFNQIRAIERQVYHPETGATFSHQLPFFGEQQYYELIGKYFQFAPGWHDYPEWVDEEGAYTVAIDPEHTGPGDTKPNVSETFRRYAREHAASQDVLRSARQLSMLFIVNHLIAAIDAAVSAKLHNDRLTTRAGLSYGPDGETVPMASVAYRF